MRHLFLGKTIEFYQNIKLVKTIKLDKKQIIVNEGDLCNGVYFVLNGVVNGTCYTLDGKENIMKIVKSGDSFGLFLCFSTNNYYKMTFITAEKSTMLFIPRECLFTLMDDHKFRENYLKEINNDYITLYEHIKVLTNKNIKAKLAYYLLSKNSDIIKINITQIAKYLNVSREALSREIKTLNDSEIIKYQNHQIKIINKDELIRLENEDK